MTIQSIRHETLLAPPLMKDAVLNVLPEFHKNTKTTVLQQFVCIVAEQSKASITIKLLADVQLTNVLIYVRTNFAADNLAETLNRAGVVAESIHDNKSQRTKTRTLANFIKKSTNVLVATESAAAIIGMEVSTIVNYDLPLSADTYTKRIATHRAPGPMNVVFSFCNTSEQSRLVNIQRAVPGEITLLDQCSG